MSIIKSPLLFVGSQSDRRSGRKAHLHAFLAFVGVFTNKLSFELLVKTPTKAQKLIYFVSHQNQ